MTTKPYFDTPSGVRFGLDTGVALLALVAGVYFLAFYASGSTILTVMLPLAMVGASVSYLLAQYNGTKTPAIDHFRVSGRTGYVLHLATVVGLAGMVFVASLTGGRTVPFYGVAVLVYTVVLAQIFFTEESRLRPVRVLAAILAYAAILRWTALLSTTSLIGIDVWVHMNYASAISGEGSLSAIAASKYFGAPLYHLLVVVAADAFNSSLRTALYATVGVVLPLSSLFVFYTGKYVLPVRWALFATAVFAVCDRFILWGLHLIPTSLGLMSFLGVVYGTTRIYSTDIRWMYSFVFLLGLATILTHQISSAILLVFLAAGTLAQLSVWLFTDRMGVLQSMSADDSVNFLGLLAVLGPLTVLDWSYAPAEGTSFLSGMITTAWNSINSPGSFTAEGWGAARPEPIQGLVTTAPLEIQVLYTLGLSVLLLTSLVGVFAVLRGRRLNMLTLTLLFSLGVMLFVVFGMPLLGLEFLVPGRWTAFMYVPLVLFGALGLWHLNLRVSPWAAAAVVLAFMLLFTGPMLVNHKAAIENPVFEDYQLTPAYTESELEAAQTIGAIHPTGETLEADKPYYLLLRDREGIDPRPDMLRLTPGGTAAGDRVVYRRQLSEQSPAASFEGREVRVTLPPDAVCRPTMDVEYSNGEVRYCTTP